MKTSERRRGFTLIELLVVLAILGALAAVALRSADGLLERSKFEATQRALEEARDAILGTWRGDEFQPGFLSDVDRLPDPTVDPAQPLLELWMAPVGMATNSPATAPLDATVVLPSGWRGPYLRSAPGSVALLDGWNSAILVEVSGGTWSLVSLGADGQPGGQAFDLDLVTQLVGDPSMIDGTVATVTGVVTIETAPGENQNGWKLTVIAYSPDPQSGGVRAREDALEDPEVLRDGQYPMQFQFSFTGSSALHPGTRAFCAYVVATDASVQTSVKHSFAVYRTLPPGATTVDLTIP